MIRPQVFVTLGEGAYRAVWGIYGLRRLPFRTAVERDGGFVLDRGSRWLVLSIAGREF
jgi:hypothetical protein